MPHSASKAMKLARMADAKRFLDWLAQLESSSGRPLAVLYTINGDPVQDAVEHRHISGYRNSCPVRTGNAAFSMVEIDFTDI